MASSSQSKEKALRPVWALLAGILVAAPLAIGGVDPPAQAGLCLAAAGLLIAHSRARRSQVRRFTPGPLPWVFGASAAWTLVQAIPLPRGLLAVLSPQAAALWDVMTPSGGWGSLSGEPLATAAAAGVQLTVGAVLAVCLDLAREPGHRQRLLWLVWGAAVTSLAVGAMQTAMGFQGPYDLVPAPGTTPFKGTFINPNHSAALLLLGVFASLGLAMVAETRDAQLAHGAVALACAVSIYLCGSNGALLGTAVGVAITTMLAWRVVKHSRHAVVEEEEDAPRRGTRAVALLALALSVPLALLATSGPDLLGVRDAALGAWELKKETIWESALAIKEYWLTGLGRGAYLDVFPRHKGSLRPYTFVAPENVEVLLLLEWGVPLGLAYMALLALWVGRSVLKTRSVLGAAAAGGLTALWLHNQVDFNLEALGVALPWCALMAAARWTSAPVRVPEEQRRNQARASTSWGLRLGVVMMLVAWIPAFRSITHDVNGSRSRASARSLEGRPAALEAHLRMHPTDYVAALNLSRLYRAQDPPNLPRALEWVNRAMFLFPSFPDTHLDAGRVLWAMGQHSQATLEWAQGRKLPSIGGYAGLSSELMARGLTVEELWDVFADDRLSVCTWMDGAGRLGEAERCVSRLMELEPTNLAVRLALASRALASGDTTGAEHHAKLAVTQDPGNGAAALMMAQVLHSQGRTQEANTFLDEARKRRVDPVELDRVRFDRAMEGNDLERARRVLADLGNSLQRANLPVVELMLKEARLEEKAGNPNEALVQFRNAARTNPADPTGALNAARLAVAAGHTDLAVSILREATSGYPHPAYMHQLNVLEGGRVRR
jgi:tetratricopeptide (TPR) repeat protein